MFLEAQSPLKDIFCGIKVPDVIDDKNWSNSISFTYLSKRSIINILVSDIKNRKL